MTKERQEQLERVVYHSKCLVATLDRIAADPGFQNVWILADIHGARYGGENWADELSALKGALACLK